MSLLSSLRLKGVDLFFDTQDINPVNNNQQIAECSTFNASNIESDLRNIILRDDAYNGLDWGQCHFASYDAAEKLMDLLSDYKPQFCVVFNQGDVYGPIGHIWLQTEVCGQTFLTDLVGAGFYSKQYGFGPHYFDDMSKTYFESGYTSFSPQVAHCGSLVSMDSDAAESAYLEAENKLYDAKDKAGTITLWESFVRWIRSF